MGVSGSGKTTLGKLLASKLNCSFLEGDDYHSPQNIRKMAEGKPLTDRDRNPWLRKIASELKRHALAKERCVVACSALKRKYRNVVFSNLKGARLIYLSGEIEQIRNRMKNRSHFMPTLLLESQFRVLERPTPDEQPIIIDIKLKKEECLKKILAQIS
tara:strand:- start:401 stop:874 length:474 start_codon:yes stop_codon:yes gene_type:complete